MTLQEMETAVVLETLNGTGQDSMESWATEAPLKLVAWALDSLGRTARSTEIKGQLEGNFVRNSDSEWKTWKNWWDRVLPAIKQSHNFNVRKGSEITLMSRVADVPAEPWDTLPGPVKKAKTKAPTVTDWKRWMLSDDASPPPGPRPTKPVCNASGQSARQGHRTGAAPNYRGRRRIAGVGQPFLTGGRGLGGGGKQRIRPVPRTDAAGCRSKPGAAGWGVAGAAGQGGRTLGGAHGRRCFRPAVCPVAGDVAAGISLRNLGCASKIRRQRPRPVRGISPTVPRPGSRLARNWSLPLWTLPNQPGNIRELDRILDCLPYRDPVYLIRDLIVRSAAGEAPRGAVLDYVAGSLHMAGLPEPTERLNLLAMASLLLSDGSGEAVNKTAEQVGAALSGAADEQQTGPVWPALLSGARQHIADLRAQHAHELEEQRVSHENQLEEMRWEVEQLNRRVEGLRALIAEGREESRMDIRQDMLLVMAETLQSLPEWADNPEALVKNVEAKLGLALGAGGAERLGTIGEIVPFDPRLHKSAKPIAIDSQVRVGVPGAMVRGKLTGDRVLIKAQVVQPSEVH